MPTCHFCGEEIPKGKGLLYVKKNGEQYYFCSSKCYKNSINLKREGRRKKWTKKAKEFKQQMSAKQ